VTQHPYLALTDDDREEMLRTIGVSSVEADAIGYLLEEGVDRPDADRLEHRLAVGVGEREVSGRRRGALAAHCSATCAL
jgi:hypothetical protein